MRPAASGHQYTAVAIVLHWAIAVAIIGNLALGLWMHEAIEQPATQARAVAVFQLHKSIGLTILLLSVIRLIWRLLHRPPPLPAGTPGWERFAAKATHWLFYVLMIGIPLSGWLFVSTQWREGAPLNVPTLWFGLFQVPHLFGLNELALPLRESLAEVTSEVHEFLAWSAIVLLVLHVVAALKHQFIDRDEVLGHMVPGVNAANESMPVAQRRGRWIILSAGFVAIVAAAGAVVIAVCASPGAKSPAENATGTQEHNATITSTDGSWIVDPARSEITFAGTNSGTPFKGHFTRWRADIRIDPLDPTRSMIAATIWTASAVDGVPLHHEALIQAEWFDVASYPTASYRATGIRDGDGEGYEVFGTLTIKNHEVAIAPLTLEVGHDVATISGEVTLDRRDFDLGMESDPDGAWVSTEIEVDVVAVVSRPR